MNSKRLIFLVIGIIFHLFYLWSIFDIYFVSPLVHGMRHFKSTDSAPAKRLFLIVGDGLRADTTFDLIHHPTSGKEEFLAPFLRNIVLNEGTYGISHTRMPTESRPGHVAMIAGFYEDVSAVTKGWKENPVDFDSTLNQSTHTYSFGSPDILPMFKAGASDSNKIDTWMYGHEFEDFSKSSIELDKFVFDHLYSLFNNASNDFKLMKEIKQDGNIFFLHLLGLDTAGHSYKPYSAEYYDNLKYIDTELSKLIPKIHDFFQDDNSAFIFTADHGMSAFGSHGDGHPNNTRTPLICWGSGIKKPVILNDPIYDDYTNSWDLHHIKRNDVNQADIASLISNLIGINYASNSVGELPLDYLDTSEEQKLKSLYQNAKAILEQYLVKEAELMKTQLNFKPYSKFVEISIEERKAEIEKLINFVEEGNKEYEAAAIDLVKSLIKVTLDGLYYLTTYNWLLLRSIVTLGFVGWIIYSFLNFLQHFILKDEKNSNTSLLNYLFFGFLLTSLSCLLYYQNSPFNYYMYLLFPIYFFQNITSNFSKLTKGTRLFFINISFFQKILIISSIIILYEGTVYGFFDRNVFTIMFIILAFYPLFLNTRSNISIIQKILWGFTCFNMSIFTTYDAVKEESLFQIILGGLLMTIISIVGYVRLQKNFNSHEYFPFKRSIILQILLLVASIKTTTDAVVSLQAKTGLSKVTQFLNWGIIVNSLIILPIIQHSRLNIPKNYKVKMLMLFLTFAPIFNILTISFESRFYCFFSLLIYQFILLESKFKSDVTENQDNVQLVRISVINFFFLQIAFFGTGNIASISAFSLESVYRLIPIFSPFLMGALLMIKLIIPYMLLSVGIGIMNHKLQLANYSISSLLISTSELLSLNFFYLVKTTGSWLDIGLTISNYCIGILSSLFIIIIEVGSNILLGDVDVSDDGDVKAKDKKNI
ncbi:hypothetical protein PACTADRAFT_4030 [Pachysolen tannophilus NRRL Y-2460]|uniref:GPI ethanolamine phosphate transferase 1 n=1 Tax=Pachysolen tannophilus NRRL Y-2460 TaxID=669874 RepID=A0A1E4TQQ8_PACTA|nr:hypothetical protein PACTADRAFT_4030 [Pachysolen tannophilus NRRL Y-2460]